MSHLKSQIPRLKPASSYGNLSQLVIKENRPKSHHGSSQNLRAISPVGTDRMSMINAPAPVTHRRMFPNYYSTRPPWAIDETISPFDKDPEKITANRRGHNKIVNPENKNQKNNFLQPFPLRLESPSPSLDYNQASLPRDEYDGHNSMFESESFKSEGYKYNMLQRQTNASQTDLMGSDINDSKKPKNKDFHTISSPYLHRTEKRLILPMKELKRSNIKNNLTYKTGDRAVSGRQPVDFDRVFNVQDRLTNRNDEDVQSRINYWLNKSIILDQPLADRTSNPNHKQTVNNPITKAPIYRNQITFTPRPLSTQFSDGGDTQKLASYASSPQIIETVIFQSDSESDKDYVVSSRSLENKLSRANSHFTIRANLASNSKTPKKEPTNENVCDACGQELYPVDQMKASGIKCHKDCFKCFWCKKKLSLANYKINSNKLCCSLHYRLVSN